MRYDEMMGRVYFNKEQYFEGISNVVWEYQIGAYQVMAKYLKDRGVEVQEKIDYFSSLIL